MEENKKRAVFDVLSSIDCSKHTEKKGKLTYLSWAWAWGIAKAYYPETSYKVYKDANGKLYHDDGRTAWVEVGVTIEGQEYINYLPVMDNLNRSIRLEELTTRNVNDSIMRCLTKALAMHGLGHYIYASEDLPTDTEDLKNEKSWNEASPENLTIALKQIKEAKNLADLKEVVRDWGGAFGKDETFIAAGKQRQEELGIY